jgi:hypothetical protein
MMQVDVIISDKVVAAEETFGGQLGRLEVLQELLGRSHVDRSDVVATLVKARMALAEIGSALDKAEAIFTG